MKFKSVREAHTALITYYLLLVTSQKRSFCATDEV